MNRGDSDERVIAVRGLGKAYRLYQRPQDRLKHMLLRRPGDHHGREFWALRDVTFDVRRGESVGIIGRNGSGKSTLLQILAGTLAPSAGSCDVKGRTAALLELGSGFNPQFTGRENVFLNGAILGLSRGEMERRFDEIAAFADIGDFIDQPVSVYSSGMFVRLAFAVQALLPKNILIVDEALAVGDEAFQRKCFASMERFRREGGTILLVSHSAQTIVRHCDRCLLLSHGQLLADDAPKPVTDLYQKLMFSPPEAFSALLGQVRARGLHAALSAASPGNAHADPGARAENPEPSAAEVPDDSDDWFDPDMPRPAETSYGSGDAEIVEVGIHTLAGRRVNVVTAGRRYTWVYRVRFRRRCERVSFGMVLKTVDGVVMSALASRLLGVTTDVVETGTEMRAEFDFDLNVAPGPYFLNAGVSSFATDDQVLLHRRVDAAMIRVLAPDGRMYSGLAFVTPSFRARQLT